MRGWFLLFLAKGLVGLAVASEGGGLRDVCIWSVCCWPSLDLLADWYLAQRLDDMGMRYDGVYAKHFSSARVELLADHQHDARNVTFFKVLL